MNDTDKYKRWFERLITFVDGVTTIMSFICGAVVVGLIFNVVAWYVPLLTFVSMILGVIAVAALRVLVMVDSEEI